MPSKFTMVSMLSDAYQIRVEPVTDRPGRKVIAVRLMLHSPKTKDYQPTKRGIRLHKDELRTLSAALIRAEHMIS